MKRKSNLFYFSPATKSFSFASFTPGLFNYAITREEVRALIEGLCKACDDLAFLQSPNYAFILLLVVAAVVLVVLLVQNVSDTLTFKIVVGLLLLLDLLLGALIVVKIRRLFRWTLANLKKFDAYIVRVNLGLLNPRGLQLVHWSYFRALELVKVEEDEHFELKVSIGRRYEKPLVNLQPAKGAAAPELRNNIITIRRDQVITL